MANDPSSLFSQTFRDDFSAATIRELRGRAGERCSMPGCEASTIGPSDSSSSGTNSLGTACHITAASQGGVRFDPSLTHEQRRGVSNGIWMCATHGRDIDNDEVRFPVATLRAWKREAEERARAVLGVPIGPRQKDDPLLSQLIDIANQARINEQIGHALDRSGAETALGVDAVAAVRDLLIEIARNSLTHGRATRVTVSLEPRRILLVDDGEEFNPSTLLDREGRGGREALSVIRNKHSKLLFAYERLDSRNRVSIIPLSHTPGAEALLPCLFEIKQEDLHASFHAEWPSGSFGHCGTVFVRLPPYLSISDAYELGPNLRRFSGAIDCALVLIVRKISVAVLEVLRGHAPAAQLVVASD